MIILTKKTAINSVQVFAFCIVHDRPTFQQAGTGYYQLRALHSAYVDEDKNPDYILIESYATEYLAKAALDKIVTALSNDEKVLDMR